ncbi:hypothetical protein [Streptomyces sp. NPDC002889]
MEPHAAAAAAAGAGAGVGVVRAMCTGIPWKMRQYAGFGTAIEPTRYK